MLYHIPRVSMRPLSFASTTIRRVWKTNSSPSTAQWAAKQIRYIASSRAYGTTASKVRAEKPTTASQGTQTERARAVKKTTAKTTAKTGVKKTTAKKPAKKAAPKPKKKKVVAKKPAVKKPKTVTKKQIQEQAKEKLDTLKKAALLDEPKIGSHSSWLTFIAELRASAADFLGSDIQGMERARAIISEAAKRFKSLPPAEIERLNHKTKQAREELEIEHKRWVSSHTPDEIRAANRARLALSRMDKEKQGAARKRSSHRKYQPIPDDRQPASANSGYTRFVMDKWSSGDFKSLSVSEAAKVMGLEWKGLSAAEKKVYEDRVKGDQLRYDQEKHTVFQS